VSSFAGASLPVSMFSDLVSLLTIHIYSFYIASARIYNWQLTIIVSLFHLFRGKKRNVLRNRIDSCDYDLDQLLLGTILFTLLFFLLPTVAVFYATFAGARIAIIALKAALDTWLACLNHFPLFALMLRVKDSRRLPGGIRFELQDTPTALLPSKFKSKQTQSPPAPTSYVKLKVRLMLLAMEGFQLTWHSPFHFLLHRHLHSIHSSGIAFANTTSPPECFWPSSQVSLFHRSTGRICTACSTACCRSSVLVPASYGDS
jgi:hypothetical protein